MVLRRLRRTGDRSIVRRPRRRGITTIRLRRRAMRPRRPMEADPRTDNFANNQKIQPCIPRLDFFRHVPSDARQTG